MANKTIVDLETDLVKPYIDNKALAIEKNLAPAENGATAVGSYSIGEQFVRGDKLYKAKTAITAGDTLTLNTNYEAADDITAQVTSLKEDLTNQIYENGAKNLLPLVISKIKAINTVGTWSTSGGNDVYTINAVTFTITSNADGFITNIKVNGTNPAGTTSDLILVEKNTRDAFAMYDLVKGYSLVGATHAGANVHFILDGQLNNVWKTVQAFYGKKDISLDISTSNNVRVVLRVPASSTASNEDAKPIIGFKSIMDSDDSFAPYAKTNRQLTEDSVDWNDAAKIGSVNAIKNELAVGTTVDSTSGLTYTVNSDGVITIVPTSGTYPFTSTGTLAISIAIKPKFPYLPCKLMGCPEGGTDYTAGYCLYYANWQNANGVVYDNGSGAIIPSQFDYSTYPYARIALRISSGTVLTKALIFKPQIAPPEYNGDYAPPAKTNKELTDDVSNLSNSKQSKFTNGYGTATTWDIVLSGGHGGTNGSRALIICQAGLAQLGFWGGAWQLAWSNLSNSSSVSASNQTASGLRLTFNDNSSLDVTPIFDCEVVSLTPIT